MKDYFGMPIKKLGFGFMRLPGFEGQPDSEIDYELTKEMVELYMERGYTYFDTAFGYHGGNSEIAIRKAVTERYDRNKFQVTTKLPLWSDLTKDEMRGKTQTSLERSGLDFFDLYFLHGVGPARLDAINKMKAWEYLRGVKDSGKSKNIGFSYHGDADTLKKILDEKAEHIDIIQLAINYLDWDPLAESCYKVARDYDVGIIVMSPVKGGSLSTFTPEVANIFEKANPDASLASWALRFPLHLDGILTVLSGMSTPEQVLENIKITEQMGPLSQQELSVIDHVIDEVKKIPTIPCTMCKYCVDCCPVKINSPGIIGQLNEYAKYRSLRAAKRVYTMLTTGVWGAPAVKSSDCIKCGECEKHCPQDIEIIKAHEDAVRIFE